MILLASPRFQKIDRAGKYVEEAEYPVSNNGTKDNSSEKKRGEAVYSAVSSTYRQIEGIRGEMRGQEGGGRLLGSGEIAGLRDNDVPRSYWSVVFRFIAYIYRRNGDFPVAVSGKKKKKKIIVFSGNQTEKVGILSFDK